RLAWITRDGPSAEATAPTKSALLAAGVLQATIDAGTVANITKSFGLSWDGTTKRWTYNNGSVNTILNLQQVAAAGREPDFFELLQAGILNGSLGKTSTGMFTSAQDLYQANTYLHVLQIGLNIIDQYGIGSYPTLGVFNTVEFSGVKNLPYLNRIIEAYYRFQGTDSVPGYPITLNRPYAGAWFQPEIWNPHQNADAPAAPAPSRFRFVATGQAYARFFQNSPNPPASNFDSAIKTFSLLDPGLVFSFNSVFRDPQLLSPALASATGDDAVSDGTQNFIGLAVAGQTGKNLSPDLLLNPGYMDANLPVTDPANVGKQTPALYDLRWGTVLPQGEVSFYLQYDDGGTWVTYSRMEHSNGGLGYWSGTDGQTSKSFLNVNTTASPRSGCFRVWVDPRTSRFGPTGSFIAANPSPTNFGAFPGGTLRPAASNAGFASWVGLNASASPGWTFDAPYLNGINPSAVFGMLTENMSSSQTRYTDPDGVLRNGDAAYASGDTGQPLSTANYSSRPMMLNRPFRSVAEMGYAFRGIPWKSLDFFTANSGDSALLDLFCLQESPTDAVVAGTVNLNTRQHPVLKAVLAGATKDTTNSGTGITAAEINSLVSSITGITGSTPLINRAELATKLGPVVSYAATPDNAIKARRETAVRALSDVGDTRTWNLLVDLVAQTGRYPASASGLAQFVVEGERRYWLHVAIDRFTGKIISQQLELVNE
ncbi:MAG: hypothetical protein ACOYM3_26575, partial [Terrimicrobiaceae bacterium]